MKTIRTSERTKFKRCIQAWYWSYIEGLKPKGPGSKHLWFGTGIHLCLSEWYGTGTERLVHPLETWEKYSQDSMSKMRMYFESAMADEQEYVEARTLGEAMLTAYLEEYGDDEQWEFIATEQSGQVRIPAIGSSQVVRYAYTFDGVYRDLDDGSIKLLETKTAAAIATGHLSLDDQAGSYWAVASNQLRRMGVLGPTERIDGITYNFMRKAMPDTRPRHPRTGERCNKPTKDHYIGALVESIGDLYTAAELKKMKVDELQETADKYGVEVIGEISKTQPNDLFLRHFVQRTTRERNAQIRRIADESQHMQAVLDGTLPITKTPQGTGVGACQHGCEFFQMCELHEAGRSWETYRDAMYHKWDPYADHRKDASG